MRYLCLFFGVFMCFFSQVLAANVCNSNKIPNLTYVCPTTLFRGTMQINSKNHLEIGGVDVALLSKKNKYPIYIIDEKLARDNMRSYVKNIKKYYSNPGYIFYAGKALMTTAICKIVEKEGLGLDLSTEGELYTAIKANFPMERVILHGNNKSEEEVELALKNGIGRIVIDNLNDIHIISKISKRLNKIARVLVRVKPGILTHTHRHIATANNESKFGFIIDNGSAQEAIENILSKVNLQFEGIHVHIGSQVLEINDYSKAINLITKFIMKLNEKNIKIKELNFGGGLGVVYNFKDKKIKIEDFIKIISTRIENEFKDKKLMLPKLMLEPGRSIIADSGTTIYKIGSVKSVSNGQIYAAVNGGMSDNIRPALYQAKYNAILANRVNDKIVVNTKIVGKCCESGDVLIEDILLPKPVYGDILAVLSTGAYNYSMASNYNKLPIPGVLLVKDGKSDWIVKPQNMQDIVKNDVIPNRLR